MNKRASLALLLASGLVVPWLGGCQTLTETPAENARVMQHTMVTNIRQIPDDTENLLLLRQPSLLSDKPVPIH